MTLNIKSKLSRANVKSNISVLDLFSGLDGWNQPFKDRGHEVVTVDFDKKFNPTICSDVMDLTVDELRKHGDFDVILASPPCNCFSIASVYRHWDKETKKPKDQQTKDAIELVGHTLKLIVSLNPTFWILENPRGMLRTVLGKPQVTTYFASWGDWKLKPTDLWGRLPEDIRWKKPKKWQKAPRGSRKGVAGLNGKYVKSYPPDMSKFVRKEELRAKIPYGLSLAVCLACEQQVPEKKLLEASE